MALPPHQANAWGRGALQDLPRQRCADDTQYPATTARYYRACHTPNTPRPLGPIPSSGVWVRTCQLLGTGELLANAPLGHSRCAASDSAIVGPARIVPIARTECSRYPTGGEAWISPGDRAVTFAGCTCRFRPSGLARISLPRVALTRPGPARCRNSARTGAKDPLDSWPETWDFPCSSHQAKV